MANPFTKGWKYLTSSLDMKIEKNADPKVQIQQATEEAKRQHREITEQASQVLGQQHQLEMQIDRLRRDQEKLSEQARTALQASDKARAEGNEAKAKEYEQTAEVLATRLVAVEQELNDARESHQAASRAAEEARRMQRESETRLKEHLAQIDELRRQVDQTAMQEKTNEAVGAMGQVNANDSVPTLDSVRDKIERRYANALGAQELAETSVSGRMEEIANTGRDMEASARLEQIRAELEAPKD